MVSNMKKVIAPKGFFFKVERIRGQGFVSVKLFKRKRKNSLEIGHVNLCRDEGWYSTHSYLHDEYRNKGLGALMYAKAIQWGKEHGLRVKSSGGSSADAQRVWRGSSLARWFDIKVRNVYSNNPNQDTFYPHIKKEDRCRASSKKHLAKRRK